MWRFVFSLEEFRSKMVSVYYGETAIRTGQYGAEGAFLYLELSGATAFFTGILCGEPELCYRTV